MSRRVLTTGEARAVLREHVEARLRGEQPPEPPDGLMAAEDVSAFTRELVESLSGRLAQTVSTTDDRERVDAALTKLVERAAKVSAELGGRKR